jgi:phosphatidylinositol-3-phosphatase
MVRLNPAPRGTVLALATAVLTGLVVAACAAPQSTGSTAGNGGSAPIYTAGTSAPVVTSPYTKVMVIAEENEADSSIIGSASAPYLNSLARSYGQASNMQAGYPVSCPSLAAYIIITSGGQQGICDDDLPSAHPLSVDNIFQQVAGAGLQWREYAESMSGNCRATDSADLVYLVRHAPPPYYSSEASRCASWDVPMGTTTSGALHSALTAGLPAYSFLTPNTCDEMHGAPSCRTSLVKRGDDWLARWMPQIIASADFQSARLVVVITWDEGSSTSNHIPTLVVARTVRGVTSSAALTHCSTLRATEEVLGLPLLGCAATATSLRTAFHF